MSRVTSFSRPFLAMLLPACLDPLPEPTTCEEPEKILIGDECLDCPLPSESPYQQCIPSMFYEPTPHPGGCLAGGDPARTACIMGDSWQSECDCREPDHPLPELPACFTQVCPERVTSVAPDAVCFSELVPESFFVEDDDPETFEDYGPACSCRCPTEVLRCDGRGFVFGGVAYGPPAPPIGVAGQGVLIPLPADLPRSGRLGVYVRARGFAAPLLVTVVGGSRSFSYFNLVSGEMQEQVSFGSTDDGISAEPTLGPYSWEDEAPPASVLVYMPALTPPSLTDDSVFNVVEVDCVVPFLVPL